MTATAPFGCRDAVARLWDLLDDQVDPVTRGSLEAHLAWCRRCCGELAFARELRAMVEQRSAAEPPPAVLERLEALIDDLPDPEAIEP